MLDSDRVLRLIIGPVLLALWLVFGAYLVDDVWKEMPSVERVSAWSATIGNVAVAGVVVVVVGYAMSLVTLLFIWLFQKWDAELPSDDEEFALMRKELGVSDSASKKNDLKAREYKLAVLVLYQGRFWDESPFKWAERRWLHFGISANGITAVVVSWILWFTAIGTTPSAWWGILSFGLIGLFFWHIYINYHAMKAMHWLASRVPKENNTHAKED